MARTLMFLVSLVVGVGAVICQAQSPDEVLNRIRPMENGEQASIVKDFRLNYIGGNIPCPAYQSAQRKDLADSDGHRVAVIEIGSITCRMKFVLVFSSNTTGWRYVGTIPLEEKYRLPKYTLVDLIMDSHPMPAIYVTGNSFANSTGYQQENSQIFAVMGSELRLVFNEPEHASLAMLSGPTSERAHIYEATQRSTFEIAKIPTYGYTSIRETRVVKVGATEITMYLEYAWVEAWNSFCATIAPPPGP